MEGWREMRIVRQNESEGGSKDTLEEKHKRLYATKMGGETRQEAKSEFLGQILN